MRHSSIAVADLIVLKLPQFSGEFVIGRRPMLGPVGAGLA